MRRTADTFPGISLETCINTIRESCTNCGACLQACAFLSRYGTPGAIAGEFDFSLPAHQAIAYECSLCGLCSAICPEGLKPSRMFLKIRRRHVNEGYFDPSAYRSLLSYERWGGSPLLSWHDFPEGCDTVFFPGCTLPGTRPEVTLRMYQQLRESIPSLGLALDCCTKPSHDLGRTAYFHRHFGKILESFSGAGVRTVLTACPNCTDIFRRYGRGLSVRTVYEIIHVNGCAEVFTEGAGLAISVHDPCPLRDDSTTHQAVRGLLSDMGHSVVEMKHKGKRTLCCGEGGAVSCVNPGLAGAWAGVRRREVHGEKLVTYCAGCTSSLQGVAPTIHIADLLYRPEAALNGDLKVAKAPFTYWNRFLLKRRIKKLQEQRFSVQDL